jgi:hypothetical protein
MCLNVVAGSKSTQTGRAEHNALWAGWENDQPADGVFGTALPYSAASLMEIPLMLAVSLSSLSADHSKGVTVVFNDDFVNGAVTGARLGTVPGSISLTTERLLS